MDCKSAQNPPFYDREVEILKVNEKCELLTIFKVKLSTFSAYLQQQEKQFHLINRNHPTLKQHIHRCICI